MEITITAQKPVSEFLNITQELVTEVREWANVLWVRVVGCRPRFVSKKVIIMKKISAWMKYQIAINFTLLANCTSH
jgi:hypothetical protein